MIRAIDYQKIDMSDDEFNYYKELVNQFTTDNTSGEDLFKDLFKTDDDGFVIFLAPKKSIPWAILFFMQQIMISQRLRYIDNIRRESKNV